MPTPTLDASTPSRTTATTSVSSLASPSFSPPANRLIAVGAAFDHATGVVPTASITNNGTVLPWAQAVVRTENESGAYTGIVSLWWAYITAARSGLVVTVSLSAANEMSMRPQVWADVDPVTPIGTVGKGSALVNTLTTSQLVPQRSGSVGVVVANESLTGGGTPTSSDTTFSGYSVSTQIAGGSGYKTLGNAGVGSTFTVDAAGTSAVEWNWVAVEIMGTLPKTDIPDGYKRRRSGLLVR